MAAVYGNRTCISDHYHMYTILIQGVTMAPAKRAYARWEI